MEPLAVYKGHTAIVEVGQTLGSAFAVWQRANAELSLQDVAWHCLQDNIFASVGDDRQLLMYVCSTSGPSTRALTPSTPLNLHLSPPLPTPLLALSLLPVPLRSLPSRWDTRGNSAGSPKPTARVEAHEAEVNAVAFAPHNENILITGSADKVCQWYQRGEDDRRRRREGGGQGAQEGRALTVFSPFPLPSPLVFLLHPFLATLASNHLNPSLPSPPPISPPSRPSPSGISATSSSSSTPSSPTPKKCSPSPGRPPTRPFSPPPRATVASTCGTSRRSGSNKLPKTRRTVLPSCCLFMVDIRVGRRIWRGARMRIGRWPRQRRIMCCRCGGLVPRSMAEMRLRLSSSKRGDVDCSLLIPGFASFDCFGEGVRGGKRSIATHRASDFEERAFISYCRERALYSYINKSTTRSILRLRFSSSSSPLVRADRLDHACLSLRVLKQGAAVDHDLGGPSRPILHSIRPTLTRYASQTMRSCAQQHLHLSERLP